MNGTPAGQYGRRSWAVWTTTALVATTDPGVLDEAVTSVRRVLAAVDGAANRFRPDSELSQLVAATGTGPRRVSTTLYGLVRTALDSAAATDGLVDPTVAAALDDLGYDRTIAEVRDDRGRAIPIQVRRPFGWQRIGLDESHQTVDLPAGCRLDLGATAKAWAADAAATAAFEITGSGVLVSLGGDLAIAGPAPAGGWLVGITDDHSQPQPDDPQIVVRSGGLATSSTTTRAWERAGQRLHHIIDPRTARPAEGPWRTVTVAAASCVDANTASTAAIVAGASAVRWLEDLQLPARLVDRNGHLTTVCGWPAASSRVA